MNQTQRQIVLVGASAVALTTLVVSFTHLVTVALAANAGWLAWLTPLSVDGLAIVSAVSLWSARQNQEKTSTSAVTALTLSLLVSVAGNGTFPFLDRLTPEQVQYLSAIVAVLPAVCLALSVEIVLSVVGSTSASPDTRVSETVTESLTLTEVVPANPVPVVIDEDPMTKLRQALAENPSATSSELAPIVGRSASWVRSKRSELVASNG